MADGWYACPGADPARPMILAPGPPHGALRRHRSLRLGRRPVPVQELGPALPPGHWLSAPVGALVEVWPAGNTSPAGRPVDDQPRFPLSPRARWLWSHSERTWSGRALLGRPSLPADHVLAYFNRYAGPVGDAFSVSVHGGADGFYVAGRRVTPETLAETVWADPRWLMWRGVRLVLNICNEFDNRDLHREVFLPLAQLFADALTDYVPAEVTVQVVAASALAVTGPDGVVDVASEYEYTDADGTTGRGWAVSSGDTWYVVFGRRPGHAAVSTRRHRRVCCGQCAGHGRAADRAGHRAGSHRR